MRILEITKMIASTITGRLDDLEHKLDLHAQSSATAASISAQFRDEVRSEMKEMRNDIKDLVTLVSGLQQGIADRNGVQRAVNWMMTIFVGVGGLVLAAVNHFWVKQ